MKVIIDGCDFTGKTTLINQIKAYYNDPNLSHLHFSYKDRKDYEFYNIMLDKENWIADRHFIDESIYPEVFKRDSALSAFEFYDLMETCKAERIKIIILTCEDKELIKRSNMRKGEEKEVLENLLDINQKFMGLASLCNLQVFDTTKNKLTEIIDYIERK